MAGTKPVDHSFFVPIHGHIPGRGPMAGSVTGYMMRIGALIPGYGITTAAALEDAGIYGVCRSAVFAR